MLKAARIAPIVLGVLAAFCVSTLDIPASVLRSKLNPKTCCGRTICKCTHPVGAKCLFKHNHAGEEGLKKTVPHVGLTHAPCHRTAPKAAVPGTFRDFEAVSEVFPVIQPRVEFLKSSRIPFPAKIQSRGIERPPRFLFSL